MEALFDIKVILTLMLFLIALVHLKKKRVYEQAVVERRGNFTPIVLSVDGLLHMEAKHFVKRIVANLAHKWEKPYSQTCGSVRARLAFAIIRATSLCLHVNGSRVKWRSGLGMDDGSTSHRLLMHMYPGRNLYYPMLFL